MTARSIALSVQEEPEAGTQLGKIGLHGSANGDARDSVGSMHPWGRGFAPTTAMHEPCDTLDRLALTDLNLLLVDETGVARDLLGRAIHGRSARRHGPFVVFDCHQVPPSIENELLGCGPAGVLASDRARSAGALGRAQGGTLFLDRIDRLPLDLQSKLGRALDAQRRKGRPAVGPSDARVIATTRVDLSAEMAAGRFRRDLFYRLAGALARVPSLRQSKSEALAPRTRGANDLESDIESFPLGGQNLWLLERAAIRQTLVRAGGDKVSAARTLGIALSTLYTKLQKHDL